MSWEQIPGWFGFRETYDEAVARMPDGAVLVEIGVAFGRSAAYLARKCIDSGKRFTLYAVDPWKDDRWEFPKDYPLDATRPTWGAEHAPWARSVGGPFSAFIVKMREHAPEELEHIQVLRTRSADAARLIQDPFFVFIDGDHNYEAVAEDIRTWRPLLAPGGILAGDDYSHEFPGVQRAVREAFGADGYRVHGTTWIARSGAG